MAEVVITCAITVDGLIGSPVPRPHGWLVLEGDSEQAQFDVVDGAAGMLLGRKRYEGLAGWWPTAAGDGRWVDRLNPMRRWVASTTLRGPLALLRYRPARCPPGERSASSATTSAARADATP